MAQWRRWCLDCEYMMGEGGYELRRQYAALTLPLLSVSWKCGVCGRKIPVRSALVILDFSDRVANQACGRGSSTGWYDSPGKTWKILQLMSSENGNVQQEHDLSVV
jgi:hypothetical protein